MICIIACLLHIAITTVLATCMNIVELLASR